MLSPVGAIVASASTSIAAINAVLMRQHLT
jgi:hypothetical protein